MNETAIRSRVREIQESLKGEYSREPAHELIEIIEGLLEEKAEWPSNTYMGVTLLLLQKISDTVNEDRVSDAGLLANTLLVVEQASNLS